MPEIGPEGAGGAGRPIQWPGGKAPGTPVGKPGSTATPGGIKGSVSTPVAPTRPGQVAPPAEVGKPGAAAAPSRPEIARPMTIEDIRGHLLSVQIEASDFNVKLASLMLRNGVELSRTNFVKMLSMLEGTDKSINMQEAALVLLMKGIDSPKAMQILGQYFAKNPGLAAQILNGQEALSNLATIVGMSKGLMDANLITQLSSIFTQINDLMKNLPAKYKFSGDQSIGRETFLSDLRALKALLNGIQDKMPMAQNARSEALAQNIAALQGRLEGLMENLISQAMLSQQGRSEVNYLYHQVPNTAVNPPQNTEIIIKREGKGPKAQIDPRNTQVVISLPTESLGRMVVSLVIKDGKVYCIFVFNEKEYGAEGKKLVAQEFGKLQKKLADKNFLVTGYQVKIDPKMTSIKPYLIPLFSKLDDILKKIDIEA